jgi:hypothetical protein
MQRLATDTLDPVFRVPTQTCRFCTFAACTSDYTTCICTQDAERLHRPREAVTCDLSQLGEGDPHDPQDHSCP